MKLVNITWGLLVETKNYYRQSLGRFLREAGLELDRKGSRMVKDIAYLEPINRHRNILNIWSYRLALSPSTHVAPNATVFGNVSLAQNVYVGFGAVVDGMANPVRVGADTKIGDNSTVQAAFWVPE